MSFPIMSAVKRVGAGADWTVLVDQNLAPSPQATFAVDVSGYMDAQVLISRVNNVGDASIGVFMSSNGGSSYETSNLFSWYGSSRATQTSIVVKQTYAGVGMGAAILRNLNDADTGVSFGYFWGVFTNSERGHGQQITPSAVNYIKVESSDLSNMDEGHIIVRAR